LITSTSARRSWTGDQVQPLALAQSEHLEQLATGVRLLDGSAVSE